MAQTLEVGPYRGVIAAEYQQPAFLERLADLPALVSAPDADERPFGRARVIRALLPRDGQAVPIAIKAFAPQGLLGSRRARTRGSKARRSWDVASALHAKGIGTPEPIGYLERWDGGRLRESYFLAAFADDTSDLHAELLQLWHEEFQLGKFLNLMDVVAKAVRAMHDAGIQHGDLGNQNILVRRVDAQTWADVRFIDVNRGRVRDALGARERAFDLSRLTLPPRLLSFFLNMYHRELFFAGQRTPRGLFRWVRRYRRLFGLHTWTRPLRHPIKWRRNRQRKREQGMREYPSARERWLWDERSDQAIATLTYTERYWYRSVGTFMKQTMAATRVLPAMKQYKKARLEAYRQPVALAGGVGMTIHPTPETAAREREYLERLGVLPLLVRYYHHETPEAWDFTTRCVRELHASGYPISLALVQDRKAIEYPERWRAFLEHVLAGAGDIAEWVEVGHATNRMKWGVWGHADHHTLLREFQAVRAPYPHLKVMGPAINDFEYYCADASLRSLPQGVTFDAMSLHLYVDRRGAPENRQHNFSSVDKFVLARVLAHRSKRCADHVIVSEVNWFLKDDGRYAHPFAPYAPTDSAHEWDVDEERYADYMMRYYLHALCSGMVDRVYWWRLVNAPFGLIDDTDASAWRVRPAYDTLRVFLERYRDATSIGRIDVGDEDLYLLRLRRADGTEDVAAFRAGGSREIELPFAAAGRLDRSGEARPVNGTISGRVTYFTDVT